MLNVSFIRSNPGDIKNDLKKRGLEERIKWVDEIIKLDKEIKVLQHENEYLRHRRNAISEEINKTKKQGLDTSKLMIEAAGIPERIKAGDEALASKKERLVYLLRRIPNITHDSVPVGKSADDNVEIRKWGRPRIQKFELKVHGELAVEKSLADFERAARIVGAGFYFLKGKLKLLELALQQFAIRHMLKKGYEIVEPPAMMRRLPYEGVVSLADFENVMYKIEGDDLYLIATSEHPLISQFMNETFDEGQLPVKLCGVSPCFRKEIGSHGVDTRGLFRVHQFNKVEQVIVCRPEDSWRHHDELQKNTEEIFKLLELPYRVVNACTGDIGMIAAKRYDIEVWSPRQKKYFEVTSASNCTSYQAVDLNIKYKDKNGNKQYVHTLNATAVATSRALVAILENNQQEDGSVTVPKVLQKYTGFKKL